MMTWGDGAAWWLMPMLVILCGAFLIVLGLLVVRWLTPGARADAVAILEHRYARGEIGDEEYQQRRRLLTGDDRR